MIFTISIYKFFYCLTGSKKSKRKQFEFFSQSMCFISVSLAICILIYLFREFLFISFQNFQIINGKFFVTKEINKKVAKIL